MTTHAIAIDQPRTASGIASLVNALVGTQVTLDPEHPRSTQATIEKILQVSIIPDRPGLATAIVLVQVT